MKSFPVAILLLLFSCGAYHADDTYSRNDWPTQETLFEHFRDADTAIIVYGKEEPDLGEAISNALGSVKNIDKRFTVLLKRDDKLTEKELVSYPLYIVGTYQNLLVRRLDETIPVDFIENGFIFDNKKYTDPSDICKLSFYPNVFNPQLPITVIAGNNVKQLVVYMQDEFAESWGYFFWESWGYQIFDHNQRVVVGNFSEDSTARWSIDKKVHWEFDYEGKTIKENAHFTYIAHSGVTEDATVIDLESHADRDMKAVEAFTGKSVNNKITYHLYPSGEIKALMLNNADQSAVDFDQSAIHTVINDEYKNRYDEAPNELALRNTLGKPIIPALEKGTAIMLTAGWEGTDYSRIGHQLSEAGLLPSIAEIISYPEFTQGTDFKMKIASALFVNFLIEKTGQDNFITHYLTWNLKEASLIAMEADWQKFARGLITHETMTGETPAPFQKGFNFAHEGYQIYNGYLGTEAEKSLAHLKDMGVNAISVIPYSGFRSMDTPQPFEITNSAGAENDASIIHTAYAAHQLGMSVMLKPQVWSWIGWTGDITMKNEQDWDQFFQYYEDWIVHYAMIAEIYHFDMLCIGVEFQNASLEQHNHWDVIFDKVRKIYSGKITYAANWGAEFEFVSFWDKLDYISVNCYYPLCNDSTATDAELLKGFESNLDQIEQVQKRYNKPVLFTEIGFTSTKAPWISPHLETEDQIFNENDQQRCFTIMQQAMSDEPWIAGVYIWKWPSYMHFSTENKKDFTPCGKAAEQTIKDWYSSK